MYALAALWGREPGDGWTSEFTRLISFPAERVGRAARHQTLSGLGIVGSVPLCAVRGAVPRSLPPDVIACCDGRIDNRAELVAALGLDAQAGTTETLVAAYARWGPLFAERLRGDFAFVIADGVKRRLIAARDIFGTRPLYFEHKAGRLILASEIEQFLAVGQHEIDPISIVNYVVDRGYLGDRTFYEGVQPVPPGKALIATEFGCDQVPYWKPDPAIVPMSSATAADRFREKLAASVERRCGPTENVIVHLSGGLDSSSVAALADRSRHGTGLVALAYVFPGLTCDESSYIAAMEERLSCPVERIDGTQFSLLDLDEPATAAPGGRVPYVCAVSGELALAAREGATRLLTGIGGDVLGTATNVFRELAGRGAWGAYLRELVYLKRGQRGSALRPLVRVARGALPTTVRRMLRRLPRAPKPDLPSFMTPDGAALLRSCAARTELPAGEVSPVQEGLLRHALGSQMRGMVDAITRYGRRGSIEFCFPFLDRDLLELVLATPLEARLPRGQFRRLHKAAMRGILPERVVNRQDKAEFGSVRRRLVETALPGIRSLLYEGRWRAEEFVIRREVQALLEKLLGQGQIAKRQRNWAYVWRVATLEAWLRARTG